MKHLLSLPSSDLIALVAKCRDLLAFDFDGTLAPLHARREAAAMHTSTQRLLAELSRRTKCAVISGRSRDDVVLRLGAATVRHVVGNHGLELEGTLPECDESIAAARATLSALALAMPGVELEDKQHSLSLHYRAAPNPAAACAELHAAVAQMVGLRVQPGKLVINLTPLGGANKGDALAKLMQLEGARCALYIGDDVTDEDVFEHEIASRLITVHVGKARRSAAQYYLQGQWEIDHLLEALLTLSAKSSE